MIAYITYVFACIIIRLFVNYPQWNTMAIAITIASGIYAISDIFAMITSNCDEELNILQSLLEKVYNKDKKVQNIIQCMKQDYAQDCEKLEEIDIMHKGYPDIIPMTNSLKKTIHSLKNTRKSCNFLSNLLIYLAFFLLFCLLSFTSLAMWLSKYQDIISVVAFAAILLIQWYRSIHTKKCEKLSNYAKGILNILDELGRAINYEYKHGQL